MFNELQWGWFKSLNCFDLWDDDPSNNNKQYGTELGMQALIFPAQRLNIAKPHTSCHWINLVNKFCVDIKPHKVMFDFCQVLHVLLQLLHSLQQDKYGNSFNLHDLKLTDWIRCGFHCQPSQDSLFVGDRGIFEISETLNGRKHQIESRRFSKKELGPRLEGNPILLLVAK